MAISAPETYRTILVERDGPVAYVTMNRPEKRNALSLEHMEELTACLKQIGSGRDSAVVILKGNGPAYCAGHDIAEMVGQDANFYRHIFDVCTVLMETIQGIPQPVIAQVHGIATAAGCQLVATCDLAVAAETARFATPGVKIGLFCTTPMVALTRNVAPKHAMEMLLTGEPIDAAEAQRIGLINRVVPDAELDAAAADLAATIASKSPAVLAIGKEAFRRQRNLPLVDAYGYASGVMAANLEEPDAAEGI